ncbi:hypothetical protein, partial [Xanthomonas citri]|uniref:hypothetical protein n=1 Tax=Xanthomonas citri TaxID=346 RepID=UPI0011AF1827
ARNGEIPKIQTPLFGTMRHAALSDLFVQTFPRSQVSKDSPKEVLPGEPIIFPESGGIIRGKQKLESLEAAAAPGYDFLNRDS